MTRELDEEMNKMCNLSEGVKEDGEIIATKKHINNLMESLNVTFEEAVVLLKIKEDFVDIIREEMNVKKA